MVDGAQRARQTKLMSLQGLQVPRFSCPIWLEKFLKLASAEPVWAFDRPALQGGLPIGATTLIQGSFGSVQDSRPPKNGHASCSALSKLLPHPAALPSGTFFLVPVGRIRSEELFP